jgi:hypothetical protein
MSKKEAAVARTLPQPYGEYLAANPAGAANVCLEGCEQELEGLPGPNFVLVLAEVAAGCVACDGWRGMSWVER